MTKTLLQFITVAILMCFASTAFAQSPPVASKSFIPSTIMLGNTSSLHLNVSNPNPTPLTGVNLTDTLPAGLVFTGSLSGTICDGTGALGGSTLTFSNLTIPAGGLCGVNWSVQGVAAGVWTNTTSVPTSNEGGSGVP